jgi:hypothetical protein
MPQDVDQSVVPATMPSRARKPSRRYLTKRDLCQRYGWKTPLSVDRNWKKYKTIPAPTLYQGRRPLWDEATVAAAEAQRCYREAVPAYSRICRGAYDRLRGLCEGYNLRVSGMARILLERVLGDESLLEMALDGDPERTSHALHHEAPMPLHSLGAAMSNEPIPLAEMSRRYLGGHWQPAPTFALTMSR